MRVERGLLDIDETLRVHRFGGLDPTCRQAPGLFAKAFDTPEGPCTLAIRQARGHYDIETYGPGQSWVKERVADMLRPRDPPLSSQAPPALKRLDKLYRGLRVIPVLWPADVALAYVLQQRVRYQDAAQQYRQMCLARPRPAPGAEGMLLPPRPQDFALPHLSRLGIDEKRGRTVLQLQRFHPDSFRLLPGVGPWTRASVEGFGLGDPDALPLGDLYFPHHVCRVLDNTPPRGGSDGRMLELLEPCRGVRFRALRLLLKVPMDPHFPGH